MKSNFVKLGLGLLLACGFLFVVVNKAVAKEAVADEVVASETVPASGLWVTFCNHGNVRQCEVMLSGGGFWCAGIGSDCGGHRDVWIEAALSQHIGIDPVTEEEIMVVEFEEGVVNYNSEGEPISDLQRR